jgi:hypothetical protein
MRDDRTDKGIGVGQVTGEAFWDDLAGDLRARLRAELGPGERLLWVGRGRTRPLPPIPVFPAFFAAFLCGTSGFALTVLFGIYGFRPMDRQMLFLLCLAPAALGAVVALGMVTAWARYRYWQWRIERSFYAVTEGRALIGRVGPAAGDVEFVSWTAEAFDGTLCIEHGDGTGAVYFLYDNEVVEPRWGFEGIREPCRVDAMIREVLLGEKVLSGAGLSEL